MFFNSVDFAIFLPIVFILYWFVTNKDLKAQNLLIVASSYFFYGWWDWKFLLLILFSTLIDFFVGYNLKAEKNTRNRKILLWLSLTTNLGLLGFFKYSNFFLDNFISAFSFMGGSLSVETLEIVLPVGISFYTFQTLSYTVDVYKKKLEPTTDFISFAAFVSFFPQLVAGPIERATHLLPQFYVSRKIDYNKFVDGMRQILWGLFKKIVIADNCAVYVNSIFNSELNHTGSTIFIAGLLFAFQIYGDFSGYSDIAIGCSRLFGFDLKRNFAFPYFSRDIAEFWRRWHISLSNWFRDYLYIPIGGSKGGTWFKIRNTFIVFLVSGFWHGANWTFVLWGVLNALYFLPLLLADKNRNNLDVVAEGRYLPSLKEFYQIISTFLITIVAWIFFRADNLGQAFLYLQEMFSSSIFDRVEDHPKDTLNLILIFVVIEWLGREKQYPLENLELKFPKPLRWLIYVSLVVSIYFLASNSTSIEFIYFQF